MEKAEQIYLAFKKSIIESQVMYKHYEEFPKFTEWKDLHEDFKKAWREVAEEFEGD